MQNQTPHLRFPEFTGDWEGKKLGEEIHDSGYGPRFNGNDYSNVGNVKTIRGTDISLDGEILYDNVPLALLDENFIKNHILEEGDLVMITTADCGLTGVFRKQKINYIPSAYAVKLKFKETANPYFFKYYFQTQLAKNQVNRFVRKGTIGNLPGSDILKFEVFFPSLPEQTKIARFLTAVDEKLTTSKQKKTLLAQYKKGIMQKIFSQELRFKNDNGNDFADWEEKKLGEVYTFKTTNSFSRENLNYEGGEVKNIHYGDIHTKFQSRFDILNEKVPFINSEISIQRILDDNYCKEGDLIIADASEDYADIGKSIEIVNLNNQKTLAGLHTLLARPDLTKISIGFGSCFMKSEKMRSQIMKIAQGSKVLSISISRMKNVEIEIPLKQEQTKIANFLSAIDDKINHCNNEIAQTETWKKGLLQQLFV